MALFGISKQAPKISNNPLQNLVHGLQRMWAKAPTRDRSELPELAHKSPRLDPIFIIARAVAGTEWNIYNKIDLKKNGKTAEPFVNPDILDLLDYPIKRYPEIDWYALCYSTVATVKAVGEYGWLKIRDDHGKLMELDPIPPAWIMRTPTVGDPTYTIYPFGVTAGVALHVSPDDFVYFKRPDLSDPYGRGRGDSEQLEQEFVADENMATMQSNFAYNDATPPYIITAPGMPQDQADAFKKSWIQKLGGLLHRREPGVIGFDAKILQLGMSPVEMDMIESRKFIRDEIYMHYQIPPEIYGNIQNSNRSTITSAEYLFHKNVLETEYKFFERVITRQIIAVEFDKNLCFKFDEVIPDDEDFKLEVYNAGMTNGTITKNEWRRAFDLPALKPAMGDVLQVTFNTYTIPINGPAPTTPTEPNAKPTGTTEDKPTDDALIDEKPIEEASKAIFAMIQKSKELEDVKKKTITIVSKSNEIKPKNKARREAIWKAFDSRATAKEGMFIEAVKKYSGKQREQVLSEIGSLNIPTKAIKAADSEDEEDYGIDDALKPVFTDKANSALKSALAAAWLASLASGRDHFYDMMGEDPKDPKLIPSLQVTNKLFNAFVEENGLNKATFINQTTDDELKSKLRQIISDGISNGDTLNTTKKAIQDAVGEVYDGFEGYRAERLAKTETTMSVNGGSFLTANASGMDTKEWLSTRDDRTRGNNPKDEFDHVDADGEIVGIDEPFTATGEDLMYPGDPNGSAGNIISCRCSVIFGNADIPLGGDEE